MTGQARPLPRRVLLTGLTFRLVSPRQQRGPRPGRLGEPRPPGGSPARTHSDLLPWSSPEQGTGSRALRGASSGLYWCRAQVQAAGPGPQLSPAVTWLPSAHQDWRTSRHSHHSRGRGGTGPRHLEAVRQRSGPLTVHIQVGTHFRGSGSVHWGNRVIKWKSSLNTNWLNCYANRTVSAGLSPRPFIRTVFSETLTGPLS